jgi:hypothetical protein
MSYYVSRQVYWPEGQHVVEIAPGLNHASADMLTALYKRLGEGQEFDDPREAAEAAILVRRQWAKDSAKRVGLSFGDADLGWEAWTQKKLLAWADKMHEKVPKCDWCGEVLGSKRGDRWQHQDFPDETFCSERCIEKMLEEQAKLDASFNDEFEPNAGAENTAIQQNENLFQDDDGRWIAEWRDAHGSWRRLGTRKSRADAFRLLVNERRRTSYRLNARSNPSRQAVGILGDVNYLEYGGAVVYADGSVDLIEPDPDDEEGPVTVYRFDADRLDHAQAEREWFGDDLEKVARTVGTTKANILRRLASANVVERATAYLDVISYFGPDEFDSDPLVFSAAEAEKRYEGIDRKSITPNGNRHPGGPVFRFKSTSETKAVEKAVRSAAAERFGRGRAVPVFEHGQWHVDVDGALYSVVNARPGIGTTGLDFEALG